MKSSELLLCVFVAANLIRTCSKQRNRIDSCKINLGILNEEVYCSFLNHLILVAIYAGFSLEQAFRRFLCLICRRKLRQVGIECFPFLCYRKKTVANTNEISIQFKVGLYYGVSVQRSSAPGSTCKRNFLRSRMSIEWYPR